MQQYGSKGTAVLSLKIRMENKNMYSMMGGRGGAVDSSFGPVPATDMTAF